MPFFFSIQLRNSIVLHRFIDCDFNMPTRCLYYTFCRLNTLRTPQKSGNIHILQLNDKLQLFVEKVEHDTINWKMQILTCIFPKQLTERSNIFITKYMKICILVCLSSLKFHFQNYFSHAEIGISAGQEMCSKSKFPSNSPWILNLCEKWVQRIQEEAESILVLLATSCVCGSLDFLQLLL